jgi:hypothetical protein
LESEFWRGVKLRTLLIAVLSVIAIFTIAGRCQTKNTPVPGLTSTRDIEKYVGTYPCSNGILKDAVLLNALQKILGNDYSAYKQHILASGCGAIERRGDYLLMDVSQLHVGGYSSLIFIRLSDGAPFLFWLKSTVAEKQWQIYGQRPIPELVMRNIEIEMNQVWGHMAKFKMLGETLSIELVRK